MRDAKTTITNNHYFEHINELAIRIICLITEPGIVTKPAGNGFQSSLSPFVDKQGSKLGRTPFLLLSFWEYPVNVLKVKEQDNFLQGN